MAMYRASASREASDLPSSSSGRRAWPTWVRLAVSDRSKNQEQNREDRTFDLKCGDNERRCYSGYNEPRLVEKDAEKERHSQREGKEGSDLRPPPQDRNRGNVQHKGKEERDAEDERCARNRSSLQAVRSREVGNPADQFDDQDEEGPLGDSR